MINEIPAQVNVVTAETSSGTEFVTLNSQLFAIYELNEWLVDTGANVHLCANRAHFVSYQVSGDHSMIMKNGSTTSALGVGRVNLKFTSGCVLTLSLVHHILVLRETFYLVLY